MIKKSQIGYEFIAINIIHVIGSVSEPGESNANKLTKATRGHGKNSKKIRVFNIILKIIINLLNYFKYHIIINIQ